ncbi:MAG: GNAT family N-acetyltransferase [Anaerolineaceae bacterium]|nr:GNAT family N-acetyltransferase [Anaerolineaceae bacterium]
MIEIRLLHTMDEMRAAAELQKVFWGDTSESLVPTHMLFSIAKYGGHVLGAYDGEILIGLLIGFLGAIPPAGEKITVADLQFASKRMVVLPEYRGHGIGGLLKWAQRDLALRLGVRLVTWTYDPLMALNAHLNIRKLGCLCRTYYPDHYGTQESSGLTLLGSSDRLLAEWWVGAARVLHHADHDVAALSVEEYVAQGNEMLGVTGWDANGLPEVPEIQAASRCWNQTAPVLLEIPPDYKTIAQTDPDLGLRWRRYTREMFQAAFGQGYTVADFIDQDYQGRKRFFYVLSPVDFDSLNGE